MPPSQSNGPAAFYSAGTPDGSRPGSHLNLHKRLVDCETQRFPDQKLSSSIFTCCLSRPAPHRWHLHLYPQCDVLDHTNQIFSESFWHPLSIDPLTTHPSPWPTQTHQTHQTHPEPSRPDHFSTLWHSAVFKPYIFWNLMAPTIHWPIALTTSPSPTQTHQTHQYME